MSEKYPRIGEIVKKREPKGSCRTCNKIKSSHDVHVQINIFRGDDEVIGVCADCKKDRNIIKEFIARKYCR